MLGNNIFYVPEAPTSASHAAQHEVHDDHDDFGVPNLNHMYCGRATIEPAQADQNYLYIAGGDFIVSREDGFTKIRSLVEIEAPGNTSNHLNVDGDVVSKWGPRIESRSRRLHAIR